MGEAAVAIGRDPAGVYYNPAAISTDATAHLLFMHRQGVQGTNTEYLASITGWNDLSLGVAVNKTSINDIPLRIMPGEQLGSFEAKDASIGLTTAYRMGSLSLGITGKFIYEKLYVEDASGFAVDIGGFYRSPWNADFGLSISNLGSMNQLLNESTTLPVIIRAGGSYGYRLERSDIGFTANADLVSFVTEERSHLHMGTELEYMELIALRLGYQTGYENKSYSLGLGIRSSMFQFDYAFVPYKLDFGTAHIFSIEILFQ